MEVFEHYAENGCLLQKVIEDCLDKLDLTSCKILTLKYNDRMSGETISNALKIKRRTYFRKYQQALNSFSSCLIKCGFDCKKIYNLVKDETWILDVFKTYLEKSKTIIWNGPLGVFEFKNFSKGTSEIAKQIIKFKGKVVVARISVIIL